MKALTKIFFFLSWFSTGLCALRYFDTNMQNDKEGIFMKGFISFKKKKISLKQAIVFGCKILNRYLIVMWLLCL